MIYIATADPKTIIQVLRGNIFFCERQSDVWEVHKRRSGFGSRHVQRSSRMATVTTRKRWGSYLANDGPRWSSSIIASVLPVRRAYQSMRLPARRWPLDLTPQPPGVKLPAYFSLDRGIWDERSWQFWWWVCAMFGRYQNRWRTLWGMLPLRSDVRAIDNVPDRFGYAGRTRRQSAIHHDVELTRQSRGVKLPAYFSQHRGMSYGSNQKHAD